MPDISIGYFNQTLIGFQNISGVEQYFGPNTRFIGFSIKLSFPLWFRPQQGKIQTGVLDTKITKAAYEQKKST